MVGSSPPSPLPHLFCLGRPLEPSRGAKTKSPHEGPEACPGSLRDHSSPLGDLGTGRRVSCPHSDGSPWPVCLGRLGRLIVTPGSPCQVVRTFARVLSLRAPPRARGRIGAAARLRGKHLIFSSVLTYLLIGIHKDQGQGTLGWGPDRRMRGLDTPLQGGEDDSP